MEAGFSPNAGMTAPAGTQDLIGTVSAISNSLMGEVSKVIIGKNENLEINLGTGEGFSVLDIIKKTESVANKNIKYVISERRVGDPDIVISSSKKANQLIGWSPKRSDLDSIIKSSWATYSYNMKTNKK